MQASDMTHPRHFQLIDPSKLPGLRLGAIPEAFRCRAKAKRTGERCACVAVKGKGLCRHHGAGGKGPSRAKQLRLGAYLRGEREKI